MRRGLQQQGCNRLVTKGGKRFFFPAGIAHQRHTRDGRGEDGTLVTAGIPCRLQLYFPIRTAEEKARTCPWGEKNGNARASNRSAELTVLPNMLGLSTGCYCTFYTATQGAFKFTLSPVLKNPRPSAGVPVGHRVKAGVPMM